MNFSVDNVKRNTRWLVCAFLGIFHFVILAMNTIAAFVDMGKKSESEGLSGYETLGEATLDSGLDGGAFLFICQLFVLIAAIAMLIAAAVIIIKEFMGVSIPDAFGPVKLKTVGGIIHLAYAALHILLLISIIVVCIANTESEEFLGETYTMGVRPAFGFILSFILSIGSFVGLYFLEKLVPGFKGDGAASAKVAYACESCGTSAKKGAAFCSKCGGKVVARVTPAATATHYCSKCGATAAEGAAFCSKCGGAVVKNDVPTCPNCGAIVKEGAVFCGGCGTKLQ